MSANNTIEVAWVSPRRFGEVVFCVGSRHLVHREDAEELLVYTSSYIPLG